MDILPLLARETNTALNETLPSGQDRFENCTDVTPLCPVDATIYGYEPNLGANIFFAVFFAICLVIQLGLGLKYRTWTYLIALGFGCLGELLGYIGRIMLHQNAWSENGFQIQICCLIISPAFVAAGVYLTLKHIVIELSPKLSPLPPRYYTWIFILCDLLSLVLQGSGGGIAATADNGSTLQDTGNDLMMAGIVWQVITLLIFLALVTFYMSRVNKSSNQHLLAPSALALLRSKRFGYFFGAVWLAFTTIFARCVYRIAEMSRGWKSPIMQDEVSFIVLEGVMIVVAVLCLTAAHPGFAFPEMQRHALKKGLSGAVQGEEKGEMSSPE